MRNVIHCVTCGTELLLRFSEDIYECQNPECERPCMISGLEIYNIISLSRTTQDYLREKYPSKSTLACLLDELDTTT